MNKKKVIALLIILILSITFIGAFTNYFKFKSERTNFTKKVIFEFDFSTSIGDVEIGPGESVNINPYVKSNASLPMYVFIRVQMPVVSLGPLYSITPNAEWVLVEEEGSYLTYAYAIDDAMIILGPEESTNALANKMTMKRISLSEFAGLDDINVSFIAYTIAVGDHVPTAPNEAWTYLKELCNL